MDKQKKISEETKDILKQCNDLAKQEPSFTRDEIFKIWQDYLGLTDNQCKFTFMMLRVLGNIRDMQDNTHNPPLFYAVGKYQASIEDEIEKHERKDS